MIPDDDTQIIHIYILSYLYIIFVMIFVLIFAFASCRLPGNDQLEFHPPIMTKPSLIWGQNRSNRSRSSTKSGLTWGCLCLSRGQGFTTLNPLVLGSGHRKKVPGLVNIQKAIEAMAQSIERGFTH